VIVGGATVVGFAVLAGIGHIAVLDVGYASLLK
jgi:hypothetical protein